MRKLNETLKGFAENMRITGIITNECERLQVQLLDDSTNPPINLIVVFHNASFTNANPHEMETCDYGDFPTNVTSLITNKIADTLLDPEAGRFYFSGGDNSDYLGKPLKVGYKWNGVITGKYITLFYLNTKNLNGGYEGKKLYGFITYTKGGETTCNCLRSAFFFKAKGKNGKKGAVLEIYPPRSGFSERDIQNMEATSLQEFDLTKSNQTK